MTLFSSLVTPCIYITILIFSDEGASGSYLTIFLINKSRSSCFMEGSTKQCSKLQPFWSPWRVEKIFGDQNFGESCQLATKRLKEKLEK